MKKLLLCFALFIVSAVCAAGFAACAGGENYSITCQTPEYGSVIVADTSVKAGGKVILASKPNKGYKLSSFILDGEDLDGSSFVMPEKDVTVSARFELLTYSITYVLNGATVSGNNPTAYTVESENKTLTAPEMEGYEVCGWYSYFDEPKYPDGSDYGLADYEEYVEGYRVTSLEGLYGNVTLYARYYNPPHVIITDGGDHGSCYVQDYSNVACYGETVDLVVEPDTGYEIDYIEVNGNKIEGTSFVMPAEDVEVKAVFKPVVYTITYVLDGGTNSPENPAYYTVESQIVDLLDAEKEGYIFIGWCLDEEHEQFIGGYFYTYDYLSDITLYAYFEEDFTEV